MCRTISEKVYKSIKGMTLSTSLAYVLRLARRSNDKPFLQLLDHGLFSFKRPKQRRSPERFHTCERFSPFVLFQILDRLRGAVVQEVRNMLVRCVVTHEQASRKFVLMRTLGVGSPLTLPLARKCGTSKLTCNGVSQTDWCIFLEQK